MNNNVKNLLQLINEHPDLPVIPFVGQDIIAECSGEWVASLGKAEIKKFCIYGEKVVFYEEEYIQKTVDALDESIEPSIDKLKGYLDSLDWLEAIVVHIETPTVRIPDNTERIYEA